MYPGSAETPPGTSVALTSNVSRHRRTLDHPQAPLHSISWHPTPFPTTIQPFSAPGAFGAGPLGPLSPPSPFRLRRKRRARVEARAHESPLLTFRSEAAVRVARAARRRSRQEREWPERPGAEGAGAGRYGSHAGSRVPAVATTQRLAWGSRGGRRRFRPLSASRRSSLRALHERHDATTLSHACGPPRDRGHDVVDVLRGPVAVLAAVAVTREDRAPGERHPAPVRHPHEVVEPDHRRHRERQPLAVELGAVARDDLRLLLEHEHDGPAHRHHAQRLEARVEQQRSSQASKTSPGLRTRPWTGVILPTFDRRALGGRSQLQLPAPVEVGHQSARFGSRARARCRTASRSGTAGIPVGQRAGTAGGATTAGRASRSAWRAAVDHSAGRATTSSALRTQNDTGATARTVAVLRVDCGARYLPRRRAGLPLWYRRGCTVWRCSWFSPPPRRAAIRRSAACSPRSSTTSSA